MLMVLRRRLKRLKKLRRIRRNKIPRIKSNKCKTIFPIVLVHGLGVQDNTFYRPWGRIPHVLRENGALCFYGYTEAYTTVEGNAKILAKRIDEILKITGSQKVNMICHSKGGIDARFAISSLGMGAKVASLTTIATPHHGVKTLDVVCLFPRFIQKIIAFFPNICGKIGGEKNPDFYTIAHQLSAKAMAKFNADNPDVEGVYYQSYATIMLSPFSDMTLFPHYLFMRIFDGRNDGVVSPISSKWTNYRGVIKSSTRRGMSHNDGVDFRRRPLSNKKVEGKYNDIVDFYVDLVQDLKGRERCEKNHTSAF